LLRVLLHCFGKPLIFIGIAQGVMELFSKYVKGALHSADFDIYRWLLLSPIFRSSIEFLADKVVSVKLFTHCW